MSAHNDRAEPDRPRRLSRAVCLCAAALLFSATTAARADQYCETLKPTDPVAGSLRKVTTRDSTGELVTNWQISLSTPVCITFQDSEFKYQQVIDIHFKKGVDLKAVDEQLGTAFGVKGKIVGYRDDRDTAELIVTEAELFTDLDDAGEVRRR